LGRGTAPVYDLIRSRVPFYERDAVLYLAIESLRQMVANGEILAVVETTLGESATPS
jgi:histidine ammonia-lyase